MQSMKQSVQHIRLMLLMAGLLFGTFTTLAGQSLDARTVLDRTADAFRRAGGVEIAFTLKSQEGTSQGTIRLKGNKFVLEAAGVKTWFDGHNQWSYVEANEEVNLSVPTAEELQSINPYAFLELYKQGYRLSLDEVDAHTYRVTMTATDDRPDLRCIMLWVDRRDHHPLKVSMSYQGESQATVIFIDSYRTGQKYDDRFFTFDSRKYPQAELIDLR